MGFSGSTRDVTIDDVRRFFGQTGEPTTPYFTEEIAEALECSHRSARDCLEALAERGEVRTKQRDDSSAVWWPTRGTPSDDEQPGEEQFRAFVSAVRDYAIFMLDPEGRIVTWNEGAERIKGYSEDGTRASVSTPPTANASSRCSSGSTPTRNTRDRHRALALPTDRRTPRRRHLGRLRTWRGGDLLVHIASCEC